MIHPVATLLVYLLLHEQSRYVVADHQKVELVYGRPFPLIAPYAMHLEHEV